MVRDLPSRLWMDLTTEDFATRDMSGVVAVLPVAAVEQHGPHLPLSVDARIGSGVLDAALAILDDDAPVLVLPQLPVGKSDEHTAFAGTLTISHQTLARVWFDIAESVHRTGCRRILFANSHGGQRALIDIVCRDIRVKLGMMAVNAAWFSMVRQDDLFGPTEAGHGIHGGAAETSLMLRLHPDLVRPSAIANFPPVTIAWEDAGSTLTAEGAVGFGWQAQDLHPSGACGDARLATADAGGILLDRSAAALARLIGELAAFPVERLQRSPGFPPGLGAAA
ncbi:MAG: creatininase family protein [Bauldia sp.]|nr:creatininase family protein [Bauldia sp.]